MNSEPITIANEYDSRVVRQAGRVVAYARPIRHANEHGALTCVGHDVFADHARAQYAGWGAPELVAHVPYSPHDNAALDQALRDAAAQVATAG